MHIPYGKQYISVEDIQAVTQALQSDFLTQGPQIASFEEAFAAYVGADYAVAVTSATAALHLASIALGVEKGSKVITTPITFAASANCISYCGGSIDFADIDSKTGLIDIDLVRRKLEVVPKGTYSGIIPVDFAGKAVDLELLRKLADEFGLWIIEDACHAPGGFFTDSKGNRQFCGNGRYAELSVFSFHPVKHIACGEGGMITTNDSTLYEKLKLLRTHGITKDPSLMAENHGGWYYEMIELGYNYRLTDFQAALGISQLKRADKGLERRRAIAKRYDSAFDGTLVNNSIGKFDEGNAYHLYVIQVSDRKRIYEELKERGIFSQVHYIPVHTLPYYRKKGFKAGDFPLAENYYEKCLSLPMYPTLSEEEQDFVINCVLDSVSM
jgi:UDP-4-amino-4,6-dideoxy-N-acetyl-beta-L-altrosamine transaminase